MPGEGVFKAHQKQDKNKGSFKLRLEHVYVSA